MKIKSVFHTTQLGNAEKIINDGWNVSNVFRHGHLYGTGIYFWEKVADAHMFGKHFFGNDYEIISEDIPYRNYITYDWQQRMPSNNDSLFFARNLLQKGIELVIVPKAHIDDTTLKQAQGNALVWLVDPNLPFHEINH